MMDDTSLTYLSSYCERAGDPAFWAEPLNAVTNLAFIALALHAIFTVRPPVNKSHADIWALLLSMIAIGFGSGLWHTHATLGSVIADIIPIYIFINIAIFSLFMRLLGLRLGYAILGWVVFQAISVSFEMHLNADTLNGSIMYIPTYGLLLLVCGGLFVKRHPATRDMLSITALFTISLACRTVDLAVCEGFPHGTHFIWHVLNAVVLYRIVLMICKYKDRLDLDTIAK